MPRFSDRTRGVDAEIMPKLGLGERGRGLYNPSELDFRADRGVLGVVLPTSIEARRFRRGALRVETLPLRFFLDSSFISSDPFRLRVPVGVLLRDVALSLLVLPSTEMPPFGPAGALSTEAVRRLLDFLSLRRLDIAGSELSFMRNLDFSFRVETRVLSRRRARIFSTVLSGW